MSLTDQINNDIKTAMKAKDKDTLTALRDIKSKLLLEATSGNGEVSEDIELKVLKKLHKQRLESLKIYQEQNRTDLAADEQKQAEIIERYLPEMMSEDAIKEAVEAKIKALNASSMADMGKVMGALTQELNGKADGGIVSKYVKEALQG